MATTLTAGNEQRTEQDDLGSHISTAVSSTLDRMEAQAEQQRKRGSELERMMEEVERLRQLVQKMDPESSQASPAFKKEVERKVDRIVDQANDIVPKSGFSRSLASREERSPEQLLNKLSEGIEALAHSNSLTSAEQARTSFEKALRGSVVIRVDSARIYVKEALQNIDALSLALEEDFAALGRREGHAASQVDKAKLKRELELLAQDLNSLGEKFDHLQGRAKDSADGIIVHGTKELPLK